MRANILFIRQCFDQFNSLCFGGCLPPIELKISTSKRTLGTFRYIRLSTGLVARRNPSDCKITISNRFDMSEKEIEDTVIHEMIHYWIWLQALDNEPSHGPVFRQKMNEINSRFNRNITIKHKSESDISITDTLVRPHYLCVTQWIDGSLGITSIARTRIFELNEAWQLEPNIENIEWFFSVDPWFNRFPKARTAKAWKLTYEEYEEHFKTATPCEIRGNMFRPIKN